MEMDNVGDNVSYKFRQYHVGTLINLDRIWNGFVLVGLTFSYFPKDHPRMEGVSKREILKQIDYVGAVLSVVGITLL